MKYIPLAHLHILDASNNEPIVGCTVVPAFSSLQTLRDKALLVKGTPKGSSLIYTKNLDSGKLLSAISSTTRLFFLMLADLNFLRLYQPSIGRDQKIYLTNVSNTGVVNESGTHLLHTSTTVDNSNTIDRKTNSEISTTLTNIEMSNKHLIGFIDITLQKPQNLAPTQGYRFEAKFARK